MTAQLALEAPKSDRDDDDLCYGRHSLYDFTAKVVDVKDVLVEHYEGRHRFERLDSPIFVYEIIYGRWP